MKRTVIFDIDGTLSNLDHRLHFIDSNPKDWDSFKKQCIHDEPIHDTVQLCDELSHNFMVILVTGRMEDDRDITEEWLKEHAVPYDALYMRKSGDYRPDYVVKKEIAEKLDLEDVLAVWEDRNQVVAMWRELGVTCYQVVDGAY